MGLFSKKEPCAICGGKVSGLFPSKIEGRLICKECYGTTDLPDNMENNMTLEEFQEYRAFREENQNLKSDFVVSQTVDFGFFGTKLVVDFEHGRFCFNTNLDGTIFLSNELTSVIVKEDNAILYSGSAEEVVRYQSAIPERVMELGPMINDYYHSRSMHDTMNHGPRHFDNGPDYGPNHRPNHGPNHGPDHGPDRGPNDRQEPPPPPPIHLPRVLDHFTVEMCFNHPYWGTKTFTVDAPDFDSHEPDVYDYLRIYDEKVALLESFVMALAGVAFPNAPQHDA